ncbi:MAG: AAA family ATPase [Candidatus Marithrix sp.]
MKDLVLDIKNVGLIKEASIKINGLTVIAGENDTGKSTVGKSLFYINHTLKSTVGKTVDIIGKNIGFFAKPSNSYFEDIFDFPCSGIKISFNGNQDDFADSDFKSYVDNAFYTTFIETPIVTNLFHLFSNLDTIQNDIPFKINYPYTLRVLYKQLKLELKDETDLNKIEFIDYLKNIMDGEFISHSLKEIIFKRNNQEFGINSVAMGIKNFGILQLLIKNNYLTKDSILIVDEPEVHLHPKWQLAYAKFIVELVKNGVKVLITSHSPYMVEAFELYSKKESINANFYLANKKDNYSIIEDVGDDLEPIYKKLAEPINELEELLEELDVK